MRQTKQDAAAVVKVNEREFGKCVERIAEKISKI